MQRNLLNQKRHYINKKKQKGKAERETITGKECEGKRKVKKNGKKVGERKTE